MTRHYCVLPRMAEINCLPELSAHEIVTGRGVNDTARINKHDASSAE